ncbi:transposase [Thiothrix lacustris]|uniref:transposase n=1 Tax=Thiothrix lacustris TaxID=525917 RepID=UPI0027E41ABE|nr:transposase [Thiothrix lacustris]WMP18775.1 transposase [Thiothrix lacustris]
MKTQIAFSHHLNPGKYVALQEQARRLGVIRSEVWQRFGSINSVKGDDRTIRNAWVKEKRLFTVLANPWKQTLSDAMGDIKASREAAKWHVKSAIRRRTHDKLEQKRLYTLLKTDQWTEDRYLRRKMRQHGRRGHNHTHNQIQVRSDDYTVFTLNGKTWIKIPSLIKGKRIAIPLSTTHAPSGNLRVILRSGKAEVHYAVDILKTHDCGTQTVGVDKGFSEVLTDSDGIHYGENLGKMLSAESDRLKLKYQRRNKLKAIAQKKPHIKQYNLGRKKLEKQGICHRNTVKTIIYTAVHEVVDKAAVIAAEDLTSPISGKKFSKDVSRRLSSWTKGVIAQALNDVSQRRGSTLILVNAAYTSQMDSRNGTLSGKRCGDSFYCEDGVVLQADHNAAGNVKARLHDPEISQWMPYQQVKSLLLKRTDCHRLKLLNPDSSCKPQGLSTESESTNADVYICF